LEFIEKKAVIFLYFHVNMVELYIKYKFEKSCIRIILHVCAYPTLITVTNSNSFFFFAISLEWCFVDSSERNVVVIEQMKFELESMSKHLDEVEDEMKQTVSISCCFFFQFSVRFDSEQTLVIFFMFKVVL